VVLLILGLCIARSAYHRMAGTELLTAALNIDGTATNPLAGLRRCHRGAPQSVFWR
jgi:hypothetical protein